MNEKYGVKGSVHTLEQRKPWKIGLEHLANFESFDVEFSPAGQVIKKTDYTYSEAIYRISRFAYDDVGKLIRAVEFDRNGFEMAVSQFEYSGAKRVCMIRDATGNITGRNVEGHDGNILTRLDTYDASGNPKRLKSFEYTKGELSWAVSEYFGANGKVVELSITRFDTFGRPVEAFGLSPDGKPTGDGRYTYEYDENGREHRILSFNDLDETDSPNAVRGFTYKCDEQGNWTERCEYSRSRSDSEWSTRVTTRRLTYYPVDSHDDR